MITKTIVWKNPQGGISITYYDDRDNYQSILSKHVFGEVINIVDGKADVPKSREHRDCWNFKNGKIEVDQLKLKVKKESIVDNVTKG